MNEVSQRKVNVMKTILAMLLTAAMFAGLCQPAQANHNGNVNLSVGYPTYSVSAFAFTPSVAVRSFAYASYPQLALQALPPVVNYGVAYPQVQLQAVDPCQPQAQVTAVQNTVVKVAADPAPTYAVEAPLLTRLTVANYGVGVGYGNSLAFAGNFHQRLGLGLHNANVNLRLATGNVLVPPVVNVNQRRRGLLGSIIDGVLGQRNNVNVQVAAVPVAAVPVVGANVNLNLNQRRGLVGRGNLHRGR